MIWAIYLWHSELANICDTGVTHFLRVFRKHAPVEFFCLWVSRLCRWWTVTLCVVRYCAFLPKDYINPNATIVAYGKVFGCVIPIEKMDIFRFFFHGFNFVNVLLSAASVLPWIHSGLISELLLNHRHLWVKYSRPWRKTIIHSLTIK